MAIGQFNINTYIKNLEKLYEEEETKAEETKGNEKEGLIIPEINKKTYDWLKKEYNSGQVEVKVEMKMGGSKFEPGYDMQQPEDSKIKDFKPGMYGDVKMGDDAKNNKAGGQDPPKGGLGGVKVKAATADDKKPIDAEKKEGDQDDKKKEKEEKKED